MRSITGGSGTPGALPYIALPQRGYKAGLYGTHALINPDFVRVGGAAGRRRGLPDRPGDRRRAAAGLQRPTKKISLAFRDAVSRRPTTRRPPTAFSAYAFDGWLVMVDAAKRALAKAQPGTPEFREALKNALLVDARKWWARTPSTTTSPAMCTASTSEPVCWCSSSRRKWKLIPQPRIAAARFRTMTPEIALLLAQDGIIATGAIYVLVALGLVLIFLVTRGHLRAVRRCGRLCGADAGRACSSKQTPGTVWLVLDACGACHRDGGDGRSARRGELRLISKALLTYAVLPVLCRWRWSGSPPAATCRCGGRHRADAC